MLSATFRAILALGLVSSWMALLFLGYAFGGAVHLLAVAAAVVTPWRAFSAPDQSSSDSQSTE